MIVPYTIQNCIGYLSRIKRTTFCIYWLIILITGAAAVSLPFIKLNISVKSQGIIRPRDEKAELKSSISRVITNIYFQEGDTVQKGDIVIQLRKENISIQKAMNDFEISQCDKYISDLNRLTTCTEFTNANLLNLQCPLYKQEYSRFVSQLNELTTQQKKISNELYIDSILLADSVIAPKEMFDKHIEHEKLTSNIMSARQEQIGAWQRELARNRLEKIRLENSNDQLIEDSNAYSIKAPVGGVLQNFNKYYQGSLVQAGEVLAIISPQVDFVAECHINTRDVGLLKKEQQTLIQVEAFDYNYFGILTGRILTIDNDYTVINDKPVFKVRCALDGRQLYLKNGFTGEIKKGMLIQARFVVTRRSLWQLLFDKIDDWVNPTGSLIP